MPNRIFRNKQIVQPPNRETLDESAQKILSGKQAAASYGFRLAVIAVLLSLIFGAVYVYTRTTRRSPDQDADTGDNQATQLQEDKAPPKFDDMGTGRSMGIVTFFHSAPLIGQIKIFADWEGKYRMVDEGSKVSFVYIGGELAEEQELFNVGYFEAKDWAGAVSQSRGKLKKIAEKEGLIFAYEANGAPSDNDELNKMLGDIAFIVGTFKTVKLQ